MKKEELIPLLKEKMIVDQNEIFAPVVIDYSDVSAFTKYFVGRLFFQPEKAGVLGVRGNLLVLFENKGMSRKPDKEVFRVPFQMIQVLSLKKSNFGMSLNLRIKIDGQKYNIYTSGKTKADLQLIYDKITAPAQS